MSDYTAPAEYDDSVRRLIDVINGIDNASVYNVTPTVGRTTIDFYFDVPEGESPMRAAQGGQFGSSIVVDTTNDEVITATLRYGPLGLPVGADTFFAKTELQKLVEQSDPPLPPDIDDSAPIHVRIRDMTDIGGYLTQEGLDIVHVIVGDRVPVDIFAEWLPRVTRAIRTGKQKVVRRTKELGAGR